jgi:hypothetical protein
MLDFDMLDYEMDNFIYIYIYLFILLLTIIEFGIRRKMQLGTISGTPASMIGRAVVIVRSVLLICAVPLLHPFITFMAFFVMEDNIPSIFSIFYYLKIILFSMWIFLVILKVFFEKKYLDTKSSILTIVFAVPVIGLLYLIYTNVF